MSNDIIFESTQTNIKEFIKGKDLDELIDLYFYIISDDSQKRPPTEMEKEFIGEFFTHDGWANFIQSIKRKDKPYFERRNNFDLPMISSVLSFELLKKCSQFMSNIDKELSRARRVETKQSNIKRQLEVALDDSYEDGIFNKVEGFSNLYETLIRYKLIKERKD